MAANYIKAAQTATNLLLTQRLYSPKIDVTALKFGKNIIFNTFATFCENSLTTIAELENLCQTSDGCTLKARDNSGEIYIVLYNHKVKSTGRRNFTLAHEIGHIFLEHESDEAAQESEANCFAAQLLLPQVLVWELLVRSDFTLSPQELAGIFGVSKTAADNRLKSFKEWNPPIFSADERLLLQKFGGILPHFDGPLIDC